MMEHARSCGRYLITLTLLALTACGGSTRSSVAAPCSGIVADDGARRQPASARSTAPNTGAIASSSTIPVPELANPGTLVVGIAVDALGKSSSQSNSP